MCIFWGSLYVRVGLVCVYVYVYVCVCVCVCVWFRRETRV